MNERSPDTRPKILLITRNLPPLTGGMERLNRRMAMELARTFQVTVVGPRGAREFLPSDTTVIEVSASPLWRFFAGTLWHSWRVARRVRPALIFGGSGLVAPFVWLVAKTVRAQTALYVHGLDLVAKHPIYRLIWRPLIRRADLCIANSRNTARLAAELGVAQQRIRVVHPGVEIPSSRQASNDFRERFGIGDGPMLLSVGRVIARKGLLEFVENSLPLIAATYPNVRLVVLGDETPDLLHREGSGLGARIRQRAHELGLSASLRFLGPHDDPTLAAAYGAADVHVFPVREVKGDVEGFGMVAIEAAAHGLPTVAFAVGGIPDAVEDGVSGYLVNAGDYAAFTARTIASIETSAMWGAKTRTFAERFEWMKFGERLSRELLRQVREPQVGDDVGA